MRLQAQSSKDFNIALQKAQKCIGSKNTIAIQNEVLLQRKNNRFFLVAGSQSAQLTIPAPIEIVDGEFKTGVTLPVKRLVPFLSTLPDCIVTFDFGGNGVFSVEYCTKENDNVKAGNVTMTYQKGDNFPLMVVADDMSIDVSMPAGSFMNVIKNTAAFCAHEELRRIMNAICVDITEDMSEMFFVATEGKYMLKTRCSNDEKSDNHFASAGKPGRILIDSPYVRVLSVFADVAGDINVRSDGNSIVFSALGGDIELVCKMPEGKYPNYNSVIPKNAPYYLNVDKKELIAVIKRVSLFTSEASRMVILEKQGMFLSVSAKDIDFALSASDKVVVLSGECAENMTIGVNAESFITSLNAVPADTVRVSMIDSSHPITITEDAAVHDVLALVMPMII